MPERQTTYTLAELQDILSGKKPTNDRLCLFVNEVGVVYVNGNKAAEPILVGLLKDPDDAKRAIAYCFLLDGSYSGPEIQAFESDLQNKKILKWVKETRS